MRTMIARLLKRSAFLVACQLFGLVGAGTAIGKEDHKLTTLVLESKYIVLAERGQQRTLKYWAKATRYKVLTVYKGPLVADQEIEIYDGSFSLEGLGRKTFSRLNQGQTFSADRETVLFLEDWEPRDATAAWHPPETPRLACVNGHRGLRLLQDGRVYWLGRPSCPGPLVPIAETEGASDWWTLFLRDSAISLREFEGKIRASLQRVEALAAALALVDRDLREASLMQLLAHLEPHPFPLLPDQSLWPDAGDDVVARRIVDRLIASGSRSLALEVISRTWPRLGTGAGIPISIGDLIDAARDTAEPLHRRLAALWLLQQRVGTTRLSPRPIDPELTRLRGVVADRHPGVRAAGLQVVGYALQASERWRHVRFRVPSVPLPSGSGLPSVPADPRLLKKMVTTAWAGEQDPLVLNSILLGVAELENPRDLLPPPRRFEEFFFVVEATPGSSRYVFRLRVTSGSVEGVRRFLRNVEVSLEDPAGATVFRKTWKELREASLDIRKTLTAESEIEAAARRISYGSRSVGSRGNAREMPLILVDLPPGTYRLRAEAAEHENEDRSLESNVVKITIPP